MRFPLRLLLLLAILLAPTLLPAVAPPAPGVTPPADFSARFAELNQGYLLGSPSLSRPGPGAQLAGTVRGKMRIPVILAGYSDRPGTVAPATFTARLFGSFSPGSMRDYFREASAGRFEPAGEVHGWVRAPRTQAQYLKDGSISGGETFVGEAIKAADALIDFGLYDNDGPDGTPNSGDDDGFVDALLVIHPGGDAAMGDSANFWSRATIWNSGGLATGDPAAGGGAVRVNRYALLPELAGDGSAPVPSAIGIWCHEFCHLLGLPDLYDGDKEGGGGYSLGVGCWDLMAFGCYGADGASPERPVHPGAWSKLRLGWVDPVRADSSGPVLLPPVAERGQVVRVWDNDQRQRGYFLLECRTRLGFDSRLPGEGLLVWHIDETILDNNAPARKLVDLEEADGLDELDRRYSLGDEGDPFPGRRAAVRFDAASRPSSACPDGSPSGVSLTGIAFSAEGSRFTLAQPARSLVTIAYDEDLPNPSLSLGFGDNHAYGAVVFTAPVSGYLEAVSTYFLYEGMDYQLELYSGLDQQLRMACPLAGEGGIAPDRGWLDIPLRRRIYLDRGDSLVVVVGYHSRGFDELRPLPCDPTGDPSGRSLASYTGLGQFERLDRDLALRLVLRPSADTTFAEIRLRPELAAGWAARDLGACFAGESYELALPLANSGTREAPLAAVAAAGEGLELLERPARVPCGSVLALPLRYIPRPGTALAGRVTVTPSAPGLAPLTAAVTARVEGWSLRQDSLELPGGDGALSARVSGAVEFSPGERALLRGARTYALHDSLRVRLRVWDRLQEGHPRVLVAETPADTLLAARGWHQLLLPIPVEVVAGDRFLLEVEYSRPGQPFSALVPLDTLRPSPGGGYSQLRRDDPLQPSSHPPAIRALLRSPSGWEGPVIPKRAFPEFADSLVVLRELLPGQTAAGSLWLRNRGGAACALRLSLEGGELAGFALERDSLTLAAGDSLRLGFSCNPAATGADTARLVARLGLGGPEAASCRLAALAELVELGHDERGRTASGGFGARAAWGAVTFAAPQAGWLEQLKVYANAAGTVFAATIRRGSDPTRPDSASRLGRVPARALTAGWQQVPLELPALVGAGDSLMILAELTAPEGANPAPLALDSRGAPSGASWAAPSAQGPWERLAADLCLRALLRDPRFAGREVRGLVLDEQDTPLPRAGVLLTAGAQTWRAAADSDGGFLFQAVPPGDYTLEGELAGYRFQSQAVSVLGDLAGLVLRGQTAAAGDLDRSGRVDIFDLLTLLRVLGGSAPADRFSDLDSDGRTDIFDLLTLLRLLAG